MNPLQNTYHGLLLNNKIYPIDELTDYCHKNIVAIDEPEWRKNIYKFILEWLDEKDYIVQNSSGTTGINKVLHLPKKAMIQSAQNTCNFFDIQFGNSAVFCLPVDYIAGKMMIVRAFVGGLNLLITEPTSMPDFSGFGKIDFCAMVPLQLYNSLNSVETIRNIKKLIIGGAEIRPELEVILHDMPNEVYATYGMAETCSHVAIRRLSGDKFERYYTAIPGVTFSVDQRSCLKIETNYLENEVITNDVVDLKDTQTFRWIGRYDNLINSGGVKIVPEEIETLISKNTGLDCALVGIHDEKLGQKLILVLEKGRSDISPDEIRNLLKIELPKHAQPKDIIIVDQLPRNSSFKVDRRKLLSQLSISG
jgi:O-succinylbenzoic acid--CoA ligase